jgi:hypothetical protein
MSSPTKAGARKTMAFGKVDEFLVVVHNKLAPTDEEWNSWLDFNVRNFSTGSTVKCLVVTEGGAPTPVQRQSMKEKLGELMISNPKEFRNAIVTASAVVRGVVTALSWFQRGYSAFSPAHMDDAMGYLEVPDQFRPEIRLLVKTLQGQIPEVVDDRRGIMKR